MFIEADVSGLNLSPSIRASSPLFKDAIFIEAEAHAPNLSPIGTIPL